MLVAFEGIDGAGKTTLASAVAEQLSLHFPTVQVGVTGFEPIDRVTTSLLADPECYDAEAHFLLSSANSRVLAKTIIGPHGAANIVLVDRYVHSSMAYSAALGVSMEWMRVVVSVLPEPDLVVWCRASVETGLHRRRGRIKNVETGSGGVSASAFTKYQTKVAKAYDEMRNADPPRWLVVETDDDDNSRAIATVVAELERRFCSIRLGT